MLLKGLFPAGSLVLEAAPSETPATWSFRETREFILPTLLHARASLFATADRDLSLAWLSVSSANLTVTSSEAKTVVAARDDTGIHLTRSSTPAEEARLDVPFARQVAPCLSALLAFLKACPADEATYVLPWLDPSAQGTGTAEAVCTCSGVVDAPWPRASGKAVLFDVDAPAFGPMEVWLATSDGSLLFARETAPFFSHYLPPSVLGWPAEASDDWSTADRPAATAIGAALRFLWGAYGRATPVVASALRLDLAAGGASSDAVKAAIEGWYPRSRKTTKEHPGGWDKITLSVPFEVEASKDGNTRRFALEDEGKSWSLTVERTSAGWFVSKY